MVEEAQQKIDEEKAEKRGGSMKIDEASINHNIVRLIERECGCVTDCIADENRQEWLIYSLSKIDGIIEMGNAMKEVLEQ